MNDKDRAFLEAVSRLAYCNPFLPERIEHERAVLGDDFQEGEAVWSVEVDDPDRPRANVWRMVARLEPLIESLCKQLLAKEKLSAPELALYEEGVLHLLYQRYYKKFAAATKTRKWGFYEEFNSDWVHFFEIPGVDLPSRDGATHVFACFRQIQRAFDQIFTDVIGGSLPAAKLRASIWQSIFTHDMRRYRRTLFSRMREFATLITGPSGTGKEIAARAIAQSRYVPFFPGNWSFADDGQNIFFPINISALSPTLVESELFGHKKGSFTGAIADRKGWLKTCPDLGSVFLDEIGDLDLSIQVKLLRVIETRTFHAVGDTGLQYFHGKLIAATHRNLRSETFREDLYYRLCSDQIVTPSLSEQLADSPQALKDLILYMSRKVAGEEGDSLAKDVSDWIENNLGDDYAWPGNFRELEQCVKNVLIRRDYRPADSKPQTTEDRLVDDLLHGRITADELISRYVTLIYRKTGSYEETARRVKLDRRTVKARVQSSILK